MGDCKTIRKVAIIGGGPKGLYGFERLAAWLTINPPSERTEIHIFNRTDSFGAGETYRTEQPSYLLMNNPVGDITMWGPGDPPPVVSHPRSLPEWISHHTGTKVLDTEFTTRAMAGRYLSNGFDAIASSLPHRVYGTYVVGEVVDIYQDAGKFTLCLKTVGDERPRTDGYDHVLLATGHPRHRKTQRDVRLQTFADQHDTAGYIPFVYPVETVFAELPAHCSVGMKGMGLAFVDAVLALTEGRGGRFVRDKHTETVGYKPSGEEPKVIYPFSRSGLPMFPRISVPNAHNELRFFTRSAVQGSGAGTQMDFERQIWPFLKQDMIHAYYNVFLKHADESCGLSGCTTFEDVERRITDYHNTHTSEIRFDVERFLDPLKEPRSDPGKAHNEYVKRLYHNYLQEARKGELESPAAAVTAVWRNASGRFCDLYAFGGLTPDSQRAFDGTIRGKLHRVTFGPPVESAEKLCALMDCGILNFDAARNPDLVLDDERGMFILQSRPSATRFAVHYLVDARIPTMTLPDDPDPLFRNLLARGLITIYENRSGKDVYRPGAINITRQGFVIDRNGLVNRGIAVTGTPTEGITFDNDTLSRERNNVVDGWAEEIAKEYALQLAPDPLCIPR